MGGILGGLGTQVLNSLFGFGPGQSQPPAGELVHQMFAQQMVNLTQQQLLSQARTGIYSVLLGKSIGFVQLTTADSTLSLEENFELGIIVSPLDEE